MIIYGAGTLGIQLLRALNETGGYKMVAFIDPNPSLAGQLVHGVKVLRPEKIGKVIADENVKEVLLATPSALRGERRLALKVLEAFPVVVKTLPALEEIASGDVQVSDLRPIDVEDLLGRDPVTPNLELLAANVQGKVVMITGAGGSIGSELTRQLLKLGPKTLVLFDLSEVALYDISMELDDLKRRLQMETEEVTAVPTGLVAVLGSVLDRKLVTRTIQERGVEVIYHAAAYKHVPIVEANPFAGLQNNTFGTLVVAEAAKECGVERFVLVSSDKAVRPTNIMGASKRLAEQILQALAQERGTATIFTMVRFGNVLDSSGSVVKLFRNQIKAGGPVTVTHPDVIRYFMSIPEAAQLVIQAGTMAAGGEVFVLEMGTPVKIDDLARTMIRLSGLDVRDDKHPDGDIAIEYVGLRPGEKLYEELLIGENTTGTSHPRIFKNSEPIVPYDDLIAVLERLEDAIQRLDEAEMQDLLRATVEGYVPASSGPSDRGQGRMAARLAHASLEGMPHVQPALWAVAMVAGCAGLSALLILILRPILMRHLLAHPNARSSHQAPTPQGAGLAVMASVFAGCAVGILVWAPEGEPTLFGVLLAAAGLTLLGAIDDAHTLSVWSRLLGQLLAAIVVVGLLPTEFRLFPDLMPAGVEDVLMVIGLMWFVNAVNFLDGLDWMTVAQVVPITLGVVVLQALGAVPPTIGLLALALLGATLGFAMFNKHPASIFLGDAGSLPIGLCLAFMLIVVAETNLAAALLLVALHAGRRDADAVPPHVGRRADFLGAPHAFLSARRGSRIERAASDGAGVPALRSACDPRDRHRAGGFAGRRSRHARPRPAGYRV